MTMQETLKGTMPEGTTPLDTPMCVTLPSGRKITVRPSVAVSLKKSLQENASLWTKLSKH